MWAKTDLGGTANTFRVLAIGSSSTEGIGASEPSHSYPADLEVALGARFPERSIHVVNAGIGGETANQTVARLEAALAKGGYDLVIWQVGTNDAIDDVDGKSFQAVMEQGISAAQHAGVPMLLVDPQYFPGISDPKEYGNVVDLVTNIGKERGVPVFSRYALMKAWNTESPGLLATMLSKDSFHMSNRGYACWASLLAEVIASRMPAIVAAGATQASTGSTPVAAHVAKHASVPTP